MFPPRGLPVYFVRVPHVAPWRLQTGRPRTSDSSPSYSVVIRSLSSDHIDDGARSAGVDVDSAPPQLLLGIPRRAPAPHSYAPLCRGPRRMKPLYLRPRIPFAASVAPERVLQPIDDSQYSRRAHLNRHHRHRRRQRVVLSPTLLHRQAQGVRDDRRTGLPRPENAPPTSCVRSRRGAVYSILDLLSEPCLHVVQCPRVIPMLGDGRRCRVELLFGGAVAALHDFGRHPRVDERHRLRNPSVLGPAGPINNSCAHGPHPRSIIDS